MKQAEGRFTRDLPHVTRGRGRRPGQRVGPYGDRYDKPTSARTVLRASTALTMAEFAARASLSERTLRNWESGVGTTRPAMLACIKAALIGHGCDGHAFARVFGQTVAEARAELGQRVGVIRDRAAAEAGQDARTRRTMAADSIMARVNRAPAERAKAAKAAAAGQAGKRQPVKYRAADTGETWSGRGLMPKWLRARMDRGDRLSDYVVK